MEYSTVPPGQSSTPQPSSRFAPYRQALAAISERTRTPLPSLVLSFAILHELTALVPLGGFFFAARAFGIGDRLVSTFPDSGASDTVPSPEDGWMVQKSREWRVEGMSWADRVGRRYGIFGLEKKPKDAAGEQAEGAAASPALREYEGHRKIAGDIANAVVAYWLTKALLPARIGLSMYFSPAFSRKVIEPIRTAIVRIFSRGKPPDV
ncbi:hypothetical protein WOLCODRAFT_80854 [Wolfiporia cocos MD-104 SS10]|uniref:Uncharacterized protein n=1 Tax=Wolfiporia cocos (strain MD-104) TaxID=742152 RepID=A0A2H3J7H9_WOLCO|nr:hypothetical protein WOLCODRAFT_80854 [Wolfiporia cocos MD-104 SS10]